MGYPTGAISAAAIVAGMIAASAWAVLTLPAGILVPIHFGFDGRPDAWARPLWSLSVLPAVGVAILVIFVAIARRANGGLARSGTALATAMLALIVFFAALHGVVIAFAFGHQLDVSRVIVLLTGLLFMVIGNVMGKVRPNHWIGIRTPWTLADDRVWDRTHRFGGWLFVTCGVLLAIAAMLGPGGSLLMGIMLTATAITMIVVAAKSYLIWREVRQS